MPVTEVESELLANLQEIRDTGYAFDDGGYDAGVRSIAVPVIGSPRSLAIGISGPDSRIAIDDVPGLVATLQSVAADLAGDIGYHP